MGRRRGRRSQGLGAGRPALFQRFEPEDHAYGRLHGRGEVHQCHHAPNPDRADRRLERALLGAAPGGHEESEMTRRELMKMAAALSAAMGAPAIAAADAATGTAEPATAAAPSAGKAT